MDLIGLIVLLIVIGLAFWVVRVLGASFGIPAQIVTVIYVILVVVVVLFLLRTLGLWGGGPIVIR